MNETPATARPVTVVLVDDHPMWREAVARDLQQAGLRVVATAGSGPEALDVVAEARPDVLVLDLQIPAPNGIAVTAQVVRDDPSIRVLVLSASGESADVLAAVKAGATGYLVKSASREELVDAVLRTAEGVPVFTPGLAGMVLGELERPADPGRGPVQEQLTERETEVLRMVATGMSYRRIAESLVLSHRTVQNHVASCLRKLHMHNRVELTRYVIEQGLEGD